MSKTARIGKGAKMNDLISRQAAIDAIRAFYDEYIVYDNRKSIEDLISELPTIDPVKHGKWIAKRDGWNGGYVVCSECGTDNGIDSKFCPNCGARME